LTIDLANAGGPGGTVPAPPTPEYWDQVQANATEHLQKWADRFRAGRLSVECVTHRGYAPDGLLQIAAARNADLIAVGTHGLGVVSRALLGSVAERVLHQAGCAVLTVRHPRSDE
jgi:nucleotide-binding universal stress UspA family protein